MEWVSWIPEDWPVWVIAGSLILMLFLWLMWERSQTRYRLAQKKLRTVADLCYDFSKSGLVKVKSAALEELGKQNHWVYAEADMPPEIPGTDYNKFFLKSTKAWRWKEIHQIALPQDKDEFKRGCTIASLLYGHYIPAELLLFDELTYIHATRLLELLRPQRFLFSPSVLAEIDLSVFTKERLDRLALFAGEMGDVIYAGTITGKWLPMESVNYLRARSDDVSDLRRAATAMSVILGQPIPTEYIQPDLTTGALYLYLKQQTEETRLKLEEAHRKTEEQLSQGARHGSNKRNSHLRVIK